MVVRESGGWALVVLLLGFCTAQLPELVKVAHDNVAVQPQFSTVRRPLQQGTLWGPASKAAHGLVQPAASLPLPQVVAAAPVVTLPVRPTGRFPLQQAAAPVVGLPVRPTGRFPLQQAAAPVVGLPLRPTGRFPLQQAAAPVVGLPVRPTRFSLQQAPVAGLPLQPTFPVMGPVKQDPAAVAQGVLLQNPVTGEVFNPLQDPLSVQSKQMLEGPEKKLTWRFPQTPQRSPPLLPPQFEMQQPVPAASVAADCGENMVHVEVKKDLFGTGEPIDPSSLALGSCAALGEDPVAQVVIFEAELQACNSVLTVTQDELIYTFTLHYEMQLLSGTPIARTGGAVTGLECHYPRLHNVSSKALLPLWVPYAATKTAEELLVFYLRLMTDDWQFDRPSNQYFLGDLMNIEASVVQFHHVPLRVFVDHCVATAVPDVNSVPRYAFIENYGCLVDAKLTGSKSRFMPRVQPDKLQFQLETFMFLQQNSSLIYLTCLLKAIAASTPTDAEHKACSFAANGWTAADGFDQVCGCCDSRCGSRKARSVAPESGLVWQGKVALGPIIIK